MWNRFPIGRRGYESRDGSWDDSKSGRGRLVGRCKEDLHADTYSEIWFSGADVCAEGLEEVFGGEVCDGCVEGADAGEYQFLAWMLVEPCCGDEINQKRKCAYICFRKVLGGCYPFECVAQVCKGVGETLDVACPVIQQVEFHTLHYAIP